MIVIDVRLFSAVKLLFIVETLPVGVIVFFVGVEFNVWIASVLEILSVVRLDSIVGIVFVVGIYVVSE